MPLNHTHAFIIYSLYQVSIGNNGTKENNYIFKKVAEGFTYNDIANIDITPSSVLPASITISENEKEKLISFLTDNIKIENKVSRSLLSTLEELKFDELMQNQRPPIAVIGAIAKKFIKHDVSENDLTKKFLTNEISEGFRQIESDLLSAASTLPTLEAVKKAYNDWDFSLLPKYDTKNILKYITENRLLTVGTLLKDIDYNDIYSFSYEETYPKDHTKDAANKKIKLALTILNTLYCLISKHLPDNIENELEKTIELIMHGNSSLETKLKLAKLLEKETPQGRYCPIPVSSIAVTLDLDFEKILKNGVQRGNDIDPITKENLELLFKSENNIFFDKDAARIIKENTDQDLYPEEGTIFDTINKFIGNKKAITLWKHNVAIEINIPGYILVKRESEKHFKSLMSQNNAAANQQENPEKQLNKLRLDILPIKNIKFGSTCMVLTTQNGGSIKFNEKKELYEIKPISDREAGKAHKFFHILNTNCEKECTYLRKGEYQGEYEKKAGIAKQLIKGSNNTKEYIIDMYQKAGKTTLYDFLANQISSPSTSLTLMIFRAIAQNLNTLHQKNILHLDAKDTNIAMGWVNTKSAENSNYFITYYHIWAIDFNGSIEKPETKKKNENAAIIWTTTPSYLPYELACNPILCKSKENDDEVTSVYFAAKLISEKTDAFALGLLWLEIICPQEALHFISLREAIIVHVMSEILKNEKGEQCQSIEDYKNEEYSKLLESQGLVTLDDLKKFLETPIFKLIDKTTGEPFFKKPEYMEPEIYEKMASLITNLTYTYTDTDTDPDHKKSKSIEKRMDTSTALKVITEIQYNYEYDRAALQLQDWIANLNYCKSDLQQYKNVPKIQELINKFDDQIKRLDALKKESPKNTPPQENDVYSLITIQIACQESISNINQEIANMEPMELKENSATSMTFFSAQDLTIQAINKLKNFIAKYAESTISINRSDDTQTAVERAFEVINNPQYSNGKKIPSHDQIKNNFN